MSLDGSNILIVLAHPEPASFTAAWARASAEAAKAAGSNVAWSDLYGLGFDPVERRDHYDPTPAPFDPLKGQEAAAAADALPRDVRAEADKIVAADVIILHFPLWWFAPPAIVKGWLDRCLVHGALHDVGNRFDTGRLRGKRALFCVTTGAPAEECGPNGKEGDTRLLLWPLAYTLRYCGMEVLDPLLVHGVHGYMSGAKKEALEARLSGVLSDQKDVLRGLDGRPAIRFNADTDFDATGRLRADAPSHSPFIRHRR
jgi:NAD(P)H dehydrogenase (quinone)